MRKILLLTIMLLPLNALAENFAWTQILDTEHISIRHVSSEEKICPNLEINGKKVLMSIRAKPTKAFENLVCEYIASSDTKEIKLNTYKMPILKKDSKTIGIIGDTGCRKNVLAKQNCLKDWPFKKVINAMLKHSPEIVIHVGDYIYREGNCIRNTCLGGGGDKDFIWEAEALEPMSKIFKKSIVIFMRGNHENCNRSHNGWFRYFDRKPYSVECKDFTEPWTLNINNKTLHFIDTSYGTDTYSKKTQEIFKEQLDALSRTNKKALLFSHRPFFFNSKKNTYISNIGKSIELNELSSFISVIFSGHAHLAEFIEFDNKLKQAILGNGGTMLEGNMLRMKLRKNLKTQDSNQAYVINDFGFGVLNIEENTLNFEFINKKNKSITKKIE